MPHAQPSRNPTVNQTLVANDVGTGTSSNLNTWIVWNEPFATTTSVTSNQIWTIWNASISATTGTGNIVIPNGTASVTNLATATSAQIWTIWNEVVSGKKRTAEEQRAYDEERVRRQAEYRAQQEAQAIESAKAKARAQKLLEENLDPKQLEELKQKDYFDLGVISKGGERRTYRIHRKWSGNIHQIDPSNGRRLKTLCIHPREIVPVEDSMLAQKLMLESGMEDELLRIANHS